jgi:HlyD family secretion protein
MIESEPHTELKSLRIDREKKRTPEPSRWATRWIVAGVLLFLLLGAARLIYGRLNAAVPVHTVRVHALMAGAGAADNTVILNATGYIVAAHKIEVASKVVGKVAWIGVEMGDRVKAGQVLVRLEDDEYRAQVMEAQGNLANLQAKLKALIDGSRPQEIARGRADVAQANADLANARVTLNRDKELYKEKLIARQVLDDAQAQYNGQLARVNSLQRTYDLLKVGTRPEDIAAMRGQVEQARGQLDLAQTELRNTVIRAPVSGTILERNVEKGEFVTTGFVGDKGAKGYVVSLADLNDLEVELDINQNDFAKLGPHQKAVITTDAYPDRKYAGVIYEISPEANRQKATVLVKVKVLHPDSYLRPEMNASVAFIASDQPKSTEAAPAQPVVIVPASAVRDGAVFVVVGGKALRRAVHTSGNVAEGVRVDNGLIGGEDVIVNPPTDLKDGERVKPAAS